MIVALAEVTPARPRERSESLLIEGFRLMRERLAVYLAFAAIASFAAALVWPRIDMYDVLAHHPTSLVLAPPVSIVMLLALAALFFILPSAMRSFEPGFRMTTWRLAVMLATIFTVGLVTELGYAFAVLPGIVAAVLLSQVLVGALLGERVGSGPASVVRAIVRSVRTSVGLTRSHFVTTLGVVGASLAILLVPFTTVLLCLAILGVRVPPSLVVMAPLLLLTFVYFECVRYALVVRWYRRLRAEERPLSQA